MISLRHQPSNGRAPFDPGKAVAAGLFLLPTVLYAVTLLLIASMDQTASGMATVFDPERTPEAAVSRQLLAAAAVMGALGSLFVSPMLLAHLWINPDPATRNASPVIALAINSVALILIFALLRLTLGVERWSLMGGWTCWTLLLFGFAWEPARSPGQIRDLLRRWAAPLVIGATGVLVALITFFPEQAVQCFNEDGTETFELARSLQRNALPAWELEIWELGELSRIGTVVVNPSLINSYWTSAVQTLLGETELATRLCYWVWWLGIFLVSCHLASDSSKSRLWLPAIPIGLGLFLNGLIFTFYVGYNPYMADLANPGVPDALFTLCLLGAFDALRTGDRRGLVLSLVMASLVLYSGPVMLVLTVLAALLWRPIPYRQLLRVCLITGATLAVVVGIYVARGAAEGNLGHWLSVLDVEYVNDYLAPVPRWKSGLLFLGYFVLGAGGIPAWGLVEAFRRGAWQRTLATVTLMYLLIVLGSGYKNLHYLAPLWPVAWVLYLSSPLRERPGLRTTRALVASASIAVCIVLAWPAQRSTFTLNRQLGGLTTFATDSYLEAVQWGRLRYTLRRYGVLSWDCDQHTWVAYAQRDATSPSPRPLLISSGESPPSGYEPIAFRRVEGTETRARIDARDPRWLRWMAGQRPLLPTERYPTIFLPLAEGPYSPHGNALEDVRRFSETQPE